MQVAFAPGVLWLFKRMKILQCAPSHATSMEARALWARLQNLALTELTSTSPMAWHQITRSPDSKNLNVSKFHHNLTILFQQTHMNGTWVLIHCF